MDIDLNKLEGKFNRNDNNFPQQKSLTQDQFNLIKESFELFDMTKSGYIELFELKLILKAFNFKSNITDLQDININSIDKNKISFEDYVNYLTKQFTGRNPRDEAIIAFDLFDEDKIGKIGLKSLKKAVKDLDENVSDQDLKAIIEEFDSDEDGFITKAEFLKILDEYYFN